MADKFPTLGDFTIPSYVYDVHEWVADSYLDGEIGSDCTLIYPDKYTECPNCIFNNQTKRSSGVYKAGGPQSFSNTICPVCFGIGRLQERVTAAIKLRVYFSAKEWKELGINVADPDGIAVCIGYMDDLDKLEKATKILVINTLEKRKFTYTREGEALPYGFRRDRYFIQKLKRVQGG